MTIKFMVACIGHLIFCQDTLFFSKNIALQTRRTTQYFFEKIMCCVLKNKVADTCHDKNCSFRAMFSSMEAEVAGRQRSATYMTITIATCALEVSEA